MNTPLVYDVSKTFVEKLLIVGQQTFRNAQAQEKNARVKYCVKEIRNSKAAGKSAVNACEAVSLLLPALLEEDDEYFFRTAVRRAEVSIAKVQVCVANVQAFQLTSENDCGVVVPLRGRDSKCGVQDLNGDYVEALEQIYHYGEVDVLECQCVQFVRAQITERHFQVTGTRYATAQDPQADAGLYASARHEECALRARYLLVCLGGVGRHQGSGD
ncbi:hypothetical protein HPB52_016998 [Rhipicephalus sanguineus]|uniref:Uncharacterized protein n=1 Tax=Rhipicephalus sanguineus TaxID=34632 RepID=A0A9D4PH31_RHISA|nr:hypothetical protein HPB52_016998 [Rhipicephalus sanguineus]